MLSRSGYNIIFHRIYLKRFDLNALHVFLQNPYEFRNLFFLPVAYLARSVLFLVWLISSLKGVTLVMCRIKTLFCDKSVE